MVLIVAASVLLAADNPKDAAKKEMEKLQGKWVRVAGEREGEGEKVPEDTIKDERSPSLSQVTNSALAARARAKSRTSTTAPTRSWMPGPSRR